MKQSEFWKHLKILDSGCWEWQGGGFGCGYGSVYLPELAQDQISAHRAAWMLAFGSIPAGLKVLHTCDYRRCINPLHLFLGTQADNVRDMIAKGRARLHCGGRRQKISII